MPTNPKISVNPLHAAFPQIFKRNGEVRRLPKAPKFSRSLVERANQVMPSLMSAKSITVETPVGLFVLTPSFTKMIQDEKGMLQAFLYNGWTIYPTPQDMMFLLPTIQEEMALMGDNE